MAETRRVVLWIAGLATVAGVVAVSRVDEEPDKPRARATRRGDAAEGGAGAPRGPRARAGASVEPDAAAIDLARLVRPPFDAGAAAAIARAWEPPPPPPPVVKPALVIAPPAPQAPPLPFRVIGQMADGATRMAFVQAGQETFVLKAGDRVQRNYRVDSVTEQQVNLTYLPLNIAQVLPLGNPQ